MRIESQVVVTEKGQQVITNWPCEELMVCDPRGENVEGGNLPERTRVRSWVGGSAEIQKMAGRKTKVVDLGSRTATPGLIDNHNHFIRGAQHWGTEAAWMESEAERRHWRSGRHTKGL